MYLLPPCSPYGLTLVLAALTGGNLIMMFVGIILLYLAIVKGFEPLLLGSIAFGCIMANFPKTGFMTDPGLMKVIHYGIANEIFPPLDFLRHRRHDRLRSAAG
jgi:oxaloacetate decarboxylase beta subunit/glutaconyl-CoA decarboxylase